MATNRTWKDERGQEQSEADWFNVVVWEKQGEACGQYLRKGSLVAVEGRLSTRQFPDKTHPDVTHYWTEVIAAQVLFLDKPSGGQRDVPPPNEPPPGARG